MGKFLALVATVAVCMLLSWWTFNAVMASTLPDWIKYLILR